MSVAGAKHAAEDQPGNPRKRQRGGGGGEMATNSVIEEAFQQYAAQLTARHDRHERCVKISRDITIQSKRTITNLQRLKGDKQREAKVKEAREQLEGVHKLFAQLGEELQDHDPKQYARAFSPGCQEYVEAVTFCGYIATGGLPTIDEINKELEPTKFQISSYDYLLGVTDLSGELMRLCINATGSPSFEPDTGTNICAFCQSLYAAYGILSQSQGKEMSKKMTTMKQSLRKIENACFQYKVRGSEIPEGGLADILANDTGPPADD